MGKRGPQPAPDALKMLRGNPGKRRVQSCPAAAPSVPACPRDLVKIRPLWDHYGAALARLRILTDTDHLAFGLLWKTYLRWCEANRKATMKVHRNSKGFPAADPLLTVEAKYIHAVVSLMDRFGMSPSSRTGLRIEAPKGEDEFTRFMNRSRGKRE